MFDLMMADEPGQKRKFEILYETYKYLMMKVAMDVLQDSYMAEDAVHNAFVNLAKNMDKIGEVDSTATKRYIITVTKNASIDLYRKRKKQSASELYMDELAENAVAVSYPETDTENRALDILKNLPVKYRDIFLLKYSVGMENREIAKLYGIKEVTVRQRIARGKEMIERALAELKEESR